MLSKGSLATPATKQHKDVMLLSDRPYLRTSRSLSMEEPDPEAEELLVIFRSFDDRDADIEGDGHGPKHRDDDSQAGAD